MNTFKYAISGIKKAFESELNIRLHVLASVLVLIAGWYFAISNYEWMLVVICIGMVISAEMINTAVEYLVDLVSPGHNELAGKIKDIAAGAVLIAAVCALITGLIIFLPKISAILD